MNKKKRRGWTRHVWTQDEREMARDTSGGEEVRRVAEKLGVSDGAVWSMRTRMRHAAGTVRPNHRWTEEENEALLAAYGQHEIDKLAAEFGVPLATALFRRAKLRRELAMTRPRRWWTEEEKAAVRACGSFAEVEKWCAANGRSVHTARKYWYGQRR